jgi:hypothetical protein
VQVTHSAGRSGQSPGAHEGLSALTRYPADYDGIFSGDPLADFAV